MKLAAAAISCSLVAGQATGGVSNEADFIQAQASEELEHLHQSETLGFTDVISDIREVAEECRQPGWDGYSALPVHPGSADAACRLLLSLPLGTTRPTVAADPGGQVTLEWYVSSRRVLSVSVGANGGLDYAATIGPSTQYGSEPFMGVAPRAILDLIRRVYH